MDRELIDGVIEVKRRKKMLGLPDEPRWPITFGEVEVGRGWAWGGMQAQRPATHHLFLSLFAICHLQD